MANSTSRENEEAAVSKLSLVRNLGQPLLQGRRALFILRNNWDCAKKCLQITTQQKSSKKCYGQTYSIRHQSLQSQYIDIFSD